MDTHANLHHDAHAHHDHGAHEHEHEEPNFWENMFLVKIIK